MELNSHFAYETGVKPAVIKKGTRIAKRGRKPTHSLEQEEKLVAAWTAARMVRDDLDSFLSEREITRGEWESIQRRRRARKSDSRRRSKSVD
jgi:hypothetical protein